ncbi:MAG: type II toxin-antitoxin system VapC family toxin [Candidatus Brocadiae bacterium]|nr:type II toxin-antitoxin system VapC family toxin [Candidatus Brocadiia bacterium]
MKLLLDTHILLWAAGQPEKLSKSAKELLLTVDNNLFFSAASIWEIIIKLQLCREDFKVNPYRLRKMLLMHGYIELGIEVEHILCITSLPLLHKDPFDRLLIAQAKSEGMLLVTVDETIAKYQESILFVK